MNNEENTNTQHVSGCNIPEGGLSFGNCCGMQEKVPKKIAIFNTDTKIITFNTEL